MLPISLFCISQTDFGGNCYLFGFSSPPGLSAPLAVRGNTEAGSSVCSYLHFTWCIFLQLSVVMVQIRQGHLSRCHGDKVTPGDDLISPWISTCVSECVLHEDTVIPPAYQMQRFTLKPNLKVKLLLFLHILTVSLFLFLTLKFLCNILAISFFFCYAYQEHFFLLIPFSLHHYLCSFQMRKEDRGQSCLQKDFDALVEGLKTLTGFHPGSGSSMARNANTAGRKREKKR